MSNQKRLSVAKLNAEGVHHLQPRLTRVARLPWVMSEHENRNLKGLSKAAAPACVEMLFTKIIDVVAEPISQPFQGWDLFCLDYPG